MTIRWMCAATLMLLLTACSSVNLARRESDRKAAYNAAAGAPVSHFRFFDLYSWEPLGDSALAVYTRPREAWLLDLYASCRNLRFAQSIGLTSNIHQVSVRYDKVLTGPAEVPCTIAKIRPVDVAKLKAVQQEQRKIEAEPRPATAPAQ